MKKTELQDIIDNGIQLLDRLRYFKNDLSLNKDKLESHIEDIRSLVYDDLLSEYEETGNNEIELYPHYLTYGHPDYCVESDACSFTTLRYRVANYLHAADLPSARYTHFDGNKKPCEYSFTIDTQGNVILNREYKNKWF
jgi:hypothetical protein